MVRPSAPLGAGLVLAHAVYAQASQARAVSFLGANEANSWLNSQAGVRHGKTFAMRRRPCALTGSNAAWRCGLDVRQQAQSELNVPFTSKYLAQQAYPFQLNGWLVEHRRGIPRRGRLWRQLVHDIARPECRVADCWCWIGWRWDPGCRLGRLGQMGI